MIFGNVVKAIRGAKTATNKEQLVEILTANEYYTPPPADARKLLKLYATHPWVRSIVAKVGEGVSRQAFYLENASGERIDKHPALDFLRRGSPKLRGRGAVKMTTTHVDLAGESFWIVGRDKKGVPTHFAVIPADWVKDVPEFDDDPAAVYEIQPKNGVRKQVAARDVIWFRDPDPLDPYGRGTGLTGAANTEIETDEAASGFLYSFFKNRARPDVIVSGTKEAPIAATDRARLETTWLERFRGPNKAGKPLFSGSPLEVKELGRGLRENEFSDVRESLRGAFFAIYGVSPEILGQLENSNRATIDSADYFFAKHTLDPRLAFLAGVIEPWLELEFKLSGLKLRYDTPIAEDRAHALAVVASRPGAFTDNEVRRLGGFKELPGLDELPEPEEPEPDPGDEKEPAEPERGDDGEKTRHVAPDVAPAAPSVVKSVSPEDIVRVSAAHEDPQVRAEATRIVEETFRSLLAKFGAELLEELEAEASFQVNAAAADWLATEAPQLMGFIDETTRKELRASLVEGAALNEGVEALVARIDAIFADAAENRAPMIGATLATKLTGFTTIEAGRQAGFERKKWLTSGDQVVRESHVSLNGQIRHLSEPFQASNGARAQHPGAFGKASEDANCRCAVRPILPGEETRAAGMSDAEFEAWHAKALHGIESKVAATMKKVFAAQKEVAQYQFRVLRGRP